MAQRGKSNSTCNLICPLQLFPNQEDERQGNSSLKKPQKISLKSILEIEMTNQKGFKKSISQKTLAQKQCLTKRSNDQQKAQVTLINPDIANMKKYHYTQMSRISLRTNKKQYSVLQKKNN